MSTTIRNNTLFCLNCGNSYKLQYPIAVTDFSKKVEAFEELHKDCPATWKEPQVNQSKSIEEKANFWLVNGEHGLSSMVMCRTLMGDPSAGKNYPSDPDDFKRCYKLLQTVPEWRSELHKVAKISTEWHNLIDNWDKLTEMYEENIRTNWKNYKKIGMYELMQKCIGIE